MRITFNIAEFTRNERNSHCDVLHITPIRVANLVLDDAIAAIQGDCSLVRRFCSPKVRKSEIKGSSFRRFCSPKVRKSDDDFYSFLL